MEEKKKVKIQNPDHSITEVNLVTYLLRDDNTGAYLVYSKGEKTGENDDEIIYISRIVSSGDKLQLQEITDDKEWLEVQSLLKKIANA